MVGPRSSDHDPVLPIELVEVEEELVAPVSAKTDDVAFVNHERHVRVFHWRSGRCDVSPHVFHRLDVKASKAIELFRAAVAESSHSTQASGQW